MGEYFVDDYVCEVFLDGHIPDFFSSLREAIADANAPLPPTRRYCWGKRSATANENSGI
jgi:hypothetical protein